MRHIALVLSDALTLMNLLTLRSIELNLVVTVKTFVLEFYPPTVEPHIDGTEFKVNGSRKIIALHGKIDKFEVI